MGLETSFHHDFPNNKFPSTFSLRPSSFEPFARKNKEFTRSARPWDFAAPLGAQWCPDWGGRNKKKQEPGK